MGAMSTLAILEPEDSLGEAAERLENAVIQHARAYPGWEFQQFQAVADEGRIVVILYFAQKTPSK
jgi:hypothetical protein